MCVLCIRGGDGTHGSRSLGQWSSWEKMDVSTPQHEQKV